MLAAVVQRWQRLRDGHAAVGGTLLQLVVAPHVTELLGVDFLVVASLAAD